MVLYENNLSTKSKIVLSGGAKDSKFNRMSRNFDFDYSNSIH